MKWNDAFELAKKYYKENGNLLVPSGYVSDGFNLYGWISKQRHRYAMRGNRLDGEEVPRGREALCDREVPHDREALCDREVPRGREALCDREAPHDREAEVRKNSEKPLTDEQVSRLESIGMVWKVNSSAWDRAYVVAETYYKEHGNLIVPLDYCVDGVKLNYWLRMQRRIRNGTMKNRKSQLTEEQIKKLDAIGMPWQPYDARWERSFAVAEKYYREHGNLSVPKNYEQDGINLSHWIWTQRRIVNGTKGETSRPLTQKQIKRLESIGIEWAPKSKGFSYYYDLARKFYDAYGHTDFPKGEVIVDGEALPESGESLAAWKMEQEEADFLDRKDGRAKEKRAKLHEIGIGLNRGRSPWDRKYLAAEQYYQEHGDLLVPYSYVTEDGIRLGRWISNQRIKNRGIWGAPLSEEQIKRLDAIGMSWDETENRGKRNKLGNRT